MASRQTRRDLVVRIAVEFSRQLRRVLSEEQMHQVVAKNYEPAYDGCCATHDFLDANESMLAAYCEVMGIGEDDVDVSATVDLMNDAWIAARMGEFEEAQILEDA